MELKDVVVGEKEEELGNFLKTLNFEDTAQIVQFPSFGQDPVKSLSTLTIKRGHVQSVVPNRIFSIEVHPTCDKILVAAGGKWGEIGLWDVTNESVISYKSHVSPVNCLTFNRYKNHQLISTSYDGTMRSFDLKAQKVELLFGSEESEHYTTYHAQMTSDSFLLTLGKSGKVGVIDSRSTPEKPSQIFNVFDRGASPKTISYAPTNQSFVVINNKAQCRIFDIRNPKKQLMDLLGHSRAISSAFFSPSDSQILTTCYDNRMRIYGVGSRVNDTHIHPQLSFIHNNHTGRWLTTFKAEWHPKREDLFLMGSMDQPRRIEAFDSTNGNLLTTLQDADYLKSVCSIVKVHPTLDYVFGGNSSGRLHCFS